MVLYRQRPCLLQQQSRATVVGGAACAATKAQLCNFIPNNKFRVRRGQVGPEALLPYALFLPATKQQRQPSRLVIIIAFKIRNDCATILVNCSGVGGVCRECLSNNDSASAVLELYLRYAHEGPMSFNCLPPDAICERLSPPRDGRSLASSAGLS